MMETNATQKWYKNEKVQLFAAALGMIGLSLECLRDLPTKPADLQNRTFVGIGVYDLYKFSLWGCSVLSFLLVLLLLLSGGGCLSGSLGSAMIKSFAYFTLAFFGMGVTMMIEMAMNDGEINKMWPVVAIGFLIMIATFVFKALEDAVVWAASKFKGRVWPFLNQFFKRRPVASVVELPRITGGPHLV